MHAGEATEYAYFGCCKYFALIFDDGRGRNVAEARQKPGWEIYRCLLCFAADAMAIMRKDAWPRSLPAEEIENAKISP